MIFIAFDNPWMFSDVDRRFYDTPNPGLTRREILLVLHIIYFRNMLILLMNIKNSLN